MPDKININEATAPIREFTNAENINNEMPEVRRVIQNINVLFAGIAILNNFNFFTHGK